MARERVIEVLNQSRAKELAVAIQYMWQHYMGDGLESPAVLAIFKETAIAEMKHAEAFGERISYLGGTPITEPDKIVKSEDLKQMIKDDLNAEIGGIELYRKGIQICQEENDHVTRVLYEKILSEEEEHHDTFQKLLGETGPA